MPRSVPLRDASLNPAIGSPSESTAPKGPQLKGLHLSGLAPLAPAFVELLSLEPSAMSVWKNTWSETILGREAGALAVSEDDE